MFDLSAKKFSKKYYADDKQKAISNWYYSLDCQSGEGLINSLLPKLQKISSRDFEFYLEFILKKCINVNRSFSDAVEFLSIWLKKSPDSLLEQLKNAQLKQFFNRTEYDHEGLNWYFPELLHKFTALVKKPVTADENLSYLFETFGFFSMPEIFVTDVIGYDRLEQCVKESPFIFRRALLSKMYEFVERNKTIDIGSVSRTFLNNSLTIDDKNNIKAKLELEREKERQELISYIQNGGLFTYRNGHSNEGEFNTHKSYVRGISNY